MIFFLFTTMNNIPIMSQQIYIYNKNVSASCEHCLGFAELDINYAYYVFLVIMFNKTCVEIILCEKV